MVSASHRLLARQTGLPEIRRAAASVVVCRRTRQLLARPTVTCCCCAPRLLQAALDAQQYAEALRQSLMEDLFDGGDLTDDEAGDGIMTAGTTDDVGRLLDASAGAVAGAGMVALGGQQPASSLADLDSELEQLSGHEVIRSILDQVCSLLYTPQRVHTSGHTHIAQHSTAVQCSRAPPWSVGPSPPAAVWQSEPLSCCRLRASAPCARMRPAGLRAGRIPCWGAGQAAWPGAGLHPGLHRRV